MGHQVLLVGQPGEDVMQCLSGQLPLQQMQLGGVLHDNLVVGRHPVGVAQQRYPDVGPGDLAGRCGELSPVAKAGYLPAAQPAVRFGQRLVILRLQQFRQ
jgi:hypothetical protein